MENSTKINKHIETYYERNNLDIPEVKQAAEGKDPHDILAPNADEKVAKQYKLYKGFLASNQIIQESKQQARQVTSQQDDPRNQAFKKSKYDQDSYGLSRSMARMNEDNSHPDKRFKRKDLRDSQIYKNENIERQRLLEGYQDPSEIAYPQFLNIDDDDEEETDNKVDPAAPVTEAKVTKQAPTQPKPEVNIQTPGGPTDDGSRPTKADFVIHEVKPTDTIEKLCIQYNVNKDVIRQANDFSGEEIYMFKELRIPFTRGKIYESFSQPNDEETKKKFAIDCMNRALKEAYKNQKDFLSEARYYLDMNDYNLDKAMSEFEADLEFEKRVVKENREHKRRQNRERIGIFSCFG